MCLMYAGFKRIAPEQDTGMDLNEPWITALETREATYGPIAIIPYVQKLKQGGADWLGRLLDHQ